MAADKPRKYSSPGSRNLIFPLRAGINATKEVPYASWCMAEWLNVAMEGMAFIRDDASRFRDVYDVSV
jgi:hypothetical protein